MKEAISKYNIMGYDYVKLDELNELVSDMRRKWREGTEVGYLCEDEGRRIAASLAMNHLSVILNKEDLHERTLTKVMKTRFEREAKEAQTAKEVKEAPQEDKHGSTPNRPKPFKASNKSRGCPGRYTVWYRDDGETTQHCMGFVKFEDGQPIFTNRPCKASWFVWRGMAERVAKKCGEGFEVVDMYDQMTKEERLLRAIFYEDGMDGEEPEYHGDGTRAEDEDWDGDDDDDE